MEAVVVTGIALDRGQAKVTIRGVPDRPGIAAQVFGAVSDHGIVVDMIVQNVSRDGTPTFRSRSRGSIGHGRSQRSRTWRRDRRRERDLRRPDRQGSIVGVGMRSHSGVAARMFQALSREGVTST
jgi:aspartate kinase